MQYWGKLFGLIFGIASGAGFWGIVIGVLLGHILDKVRARNLGADAKGPTRQLLFFRSTFQVLGHITKAKGRVTETDIQLATQLMDRMQLHGEARLAAQQAFREGKQPQFPLRETLRQLRRACFGRFDLIRMFLEIQLQAAFADGELHPNERKVLFVIAEELGISRVQFEQFLAMMEGGRHFDGQNFGGQHQQYGHYQGRGQQRATLADACKVLGVNEQDDATTIKRAYRKLMSEHHPDKLVAKGLPPEMMELAKQKAQSIQSAYDLIKKEKGFK
ncbi:co-chaperone DjlA [Xenorhabdus khoisanae]|uniref:Co-chaperone protein DjlA n=1 Tax=Xenorhabdus khoisanae TaxID=880157 RepID=A0A0J5FQL1_9GAMM|nr:co-chaperone DjlA [Xenorhabdus khoisanae]KMJ44533.1 Dna-J like membrane chaperone protein [Xenorhabdus khoisanae]MDC9612512.1 co-chaperone DjlA [Xenorhabdus khoisanae]